MFHKNQERGMDQTMNLQRLNKLTLILAVVTILSSCTYSTPQKNLITISTFNNLYEQYLDLYDKQPEATKLKWREEIDPYWSIASKSLEIYLTTTNQEEAKEKLKLLIEAETTIISLLQSYGFKLEE